MVLFPILAKESETKDFSNKEINQYIVYLTSILSHAAAKCMQKQAMRSGGYLTQNDVSKILEETIRCICVLFHNKITTFLSLNSKPSAQVHEVLRII